MSFHFLSILHHDSEDCQQSQSLDSEFDSSKSLPVKALCRQSASFLADFYGYQGKVDPGLFLMEPSNSLGLRGQVLLEDLSLQDSEETSPDLFLGLQFGTQLLENLYTSTTSDKPNQTSETVLSYTKFGILVEEISHFSLLAQAAEGQNQISILDLEILGEIDRFVTLFYWNAWSKGPLLNKSWRNLGELCADLFEGERFPQNTDPLYFRAESEAFCHIKEAFSSVWQCSVVDHFSFHQSALSYLQRLRKHVLKPKNRAA